MEIKCVENKQTRNKIEMHARGVLTVFRGVQELKKIGIGLKRHGLLGFRGSAGYRFGSDPGSDPV